MRDRAVRSAQLRKARRKLRSRGCLCAPADLGFDLIEAVLTPGAEIRLTRRSAKTKARHSPVAHRKHFFTVGFELGSPALLVHVATRIGPCKAGAFDDVAQTFVASRRDALGERGTPER